MAEQPSRFALDLGNHFQARLHALMSDTADTGLRGGMTHKSIANVIVSVLQAEAAMGALSLEVTEENFAALAAYSHRMALKTIRPPRKRKSK